MISITVRMPNPLMPHLLLIIFLTISINLATRVDYMPWYKCFYAIYRDSQTRLMTEDVFMQGRMLIFCYSGDG